MHTRLIMQKIVHSNIHDEAASMQWRPTLEAAVLGLYIRMFTCSSTVVCSRSVEYMTQQHSNQQHRDTMLSHLDLITTTTTTTTTAAATTTAATGYHCCCCYCYCYYCCCYYYYYCCCFCCYCCCFQYIWWAGVYDRLQPQALRLKAVQQCVKNVSSLMPTQIYGYFSTFAAIFGYLCSHRDCSNLQS